MSNRPYFRYNIEQLREVFDSSANDNETLLNLQFELQHRSVPKAKKLLKEIDSILSGELKFVQPVAKSFTIECPECKTSTNIYVLNEDKQYFSCSGCQLAFEAQLKNGILQTNFARREVEIPVTSPILPPTPVPTTHTPLPEPTVPDQVLVECPKCHTPNFVFNKVERVQHLACSNCKQTFEAEFKYGVLRTNFITQQSDESHSNQNIYLFLAIGIAIIIALAIFFK